MSRTQRDHLYTFTDTFETIVCDAGGCHSEVHGALPGDPVKAPDEWYTVTTGPRDLLGHRDTLHFCSPRCLSSWVSAQVVERALAERPEAPLAPAVAVDESFILDQPQDAGDPFTPAVEEPAHVDATPADA